MINDLPYYPGYEWRAVGDDLVLVALEHCHRDRRD